MKYPNLPDWFYDGALVYYQSEGSLEIVYNIRERKNGEFLFNYKALAGPYVQLGDLADCLSVDQIKIRYEPL